MNKTFTLIVLLIVGILVLFGALTILLLTRGVFNKTANTIAKIGTYANITVTDKGFSPSEVKAPKDSVVHFINKTSKTLEIVPQGENKILVVPLVPGKTTISFVMSKPGVYEFTLKEDSSKKGKVTIE